MKIKSGFMTRKIGDKIVGIAVGTRANEFDGMINLNDTGLFIWNCLKENTTINDVAKKLVAEYGIDIDKATASATRFVDDLRKNNLIEE